MEFNCKCYYTLIKRGTLYVCYFIGVQWFDSINEQFFFLQSCSNKIVLCSSNELFSIDFFLWVCVMGNFCQLFPINNPEQKRKYTRTNSDKENNQNKFSKTKIHSIFSWKQVQSFIHQNCWFIHFEYIFPNRSPAEIVQNYTRVGTNGISFRIKHVQYKTKHLINLSILPFRLKFIYQPNWSENWYRN